MILEDQVSAQPGLVELSACHRLRRLAADVPAHQCIVELGSYHGWSTSWLLLGAQDGHGAKVVAVDRWAPRDRYRGWSPDFGPGAHQRFGERMHRIGATEAELVVHNDWAVEVGKGWAGPPVGLLFHDAGHSADEVESDLNAWLPHLAERAQVVLHDAARADYGVVEGAVRVIGPGWAYRGEDGCDYQEPQVIRWPEQPDRRGLLVAHRCQP